MNSPKNSDIDAFKQHLKDRGYKLTPQRRAVLDKIIENEGKHLTTEEIYDLVKSDCPEIGLATVYRTLQLLEEMNLIFKLNLNDGINRYELVHDEEDHYHHHLICVKCGKVIEVEGDLLEALEKEVEKQYKFNITNHLLKFFGTCVECDKEL
ncbi:ferric uptake regulation protein [Oxobacter pfennigii]|uniref:Ferric uptake regulation protein n=1 Tax=Oxobacter pfennigii TaxID=36849 RepID=A0A0P8WAG0_9CLOT|nr:Fur family transcriptional regulator [Oxobacter pfennigii]KPU44949.1 ferric uptake regulation protein [Oxobacter pfennigii]